MDSDLPSVRATEVVQQRQGQYGHPGPIYGQVAGLWSAYLRCRVTPEDVAACMILLKLSREKSKHHTDNLIDVAGYANVQHMVREYFADGGELD